MTIPWRRSLPWANAAPPSRAAEAARKAAAPAAPPAEEEAQRQARQAEKRRRFERIGEIKAAAAEEEIAAGLPGEFAELLRAARALQQGDTPDYEALRQLLLLPEARAATAAGASVGAQGGARARRVAIAQRRPAPPIRRRRLEARRGPRFVP